jgi:hypothetical protein
VAIGELEGIQRRQFGDEVDDALAQSGHANPLE